MTDILTPSETTLPWQPITTAPRDGREVLLIVKMRAGIPGKMLVGHYMPGGFCVEDHPPIDTGWYFWNGCFFDQAADPTHWMPLPPDAATISALRTVAEVAERVLATHDTLPSDHHPTMFELERLIRPMSDLRAALAKVRGAQ